MKTRIILILAAGAVGCILAGVFFKHQPQKSVVQNTSPAFSQPVANPSAPENLAGEKVAEVSRPLEKAVGQPAPKQNAGRPANPKPEPQDPDARVALSLVGVDPEAEQYWMSAIFNPNLPDEERADLMEDLNEEGLSDPKHPTPEDLVVIANRLGPIEDALQGADPFMQEHLAEARKDLLNLLNGQ